MSSQWAISAGSIGCHIDHSTWTAAIAWEAFQYAANWSGEVCTWNWVLVQAASGRIESVVVISRDQRSGVVGDAVHSGAFA